MSIFGFFDLQDALAAVIADDEIRVVAGTYTLTVPDGDRRISFGLWSGVGLLRSFCGHEKSVGSTQIPRKVGLESGF